MISGGESLGDRMKGYERAARMALPRRMPVVIRVDGKAFHTVTRDCERPFDARLIGIMNGVAKNLCEEVQGAVLAYVQSDEISVLVHNYRRLQTDAWFDNEVQKMASVSAAVAAAHFSMSWGKPVYFDARVFVLPEPEVCNYFIWRQQDATRNSIQMATRAVYAHKEVNGLNTTEMQDLLHAKNINWNDYPIGHKRGRTVVRRSKPIPESDVERHSWEVEDPPIFTQDRDYITQRLAVEPDDG